MSAKHLLIVTQRLGILILNISLLILLVGESEARGECKGKTCPKTPPKASAVKAAKAAKAVKAAPAPAPVAKAVKAKAQTAVAAPAPKVGKATAAPAVAAPAAPVAGPTGTQLPGMSKAAANELSTEALKAHRADLLARLESEKRALQATNQIDNPDGFKEHKENIENLEDQIGQMDELLAQRQVQAVGNIKPAAANPAAVTPVATTAVSTATYTTAPFITANLSRRGCDMGDITAIGAVPALPVEASAPVLLADPGFAELAGNSNSLLENLKLLRTVLNQSLTELGLLFTKCTQAQSQSELDSIVADIKTAKEDYKKSLDEYREAEKAFIDSTVALRQKMVELFTPKAP